MLAQSRAECLECRQSDKMTGENGGMHINKAKPAKKGEGAHEAENIRM